MSVVTKFLGGDDGQEFSLVHPFSIGGRTETEVDQLIINGQAHGGEGGEIKDELTFDADEYINLMAIRSGSRIDSILYRFSGETSTSVSAEYLAKVSSELKTSFFNEKQLIEEYEKEAKNSRTTKIVVAQERVALEVSKIQVLEDVNGQYWFFPLLTSSNTIIVPVTQPIQGSILDLTGAIDSQIPSMSSHKESKYGQDFYALKK